MKKLNTKTLCLAAMFTALSVVADMLSIDINPPLNKLSFVSTVCFLGGWFLGAPLGFTVGFLGDLIGFLIRPSGFAYSPIIGITTGLWGLFPALFRIIYEKRISDNKFIQTLMIVASYLCCYVICSMFINTFAQWFLFSSMKKTFWAYLAVRLPFQTLITGANLLLTIIIWFTLSKLSFFNEYFPVMHRKEQES